MKICKTCKHWQSHAKDGLPDLGICFACDELFGATEWSKNFDRLQYKESVKDINMFCQDGSDYSAMLYTRENHYCSDYKENTKWMKR